MDASIAIKWYLWEDRSDQARGLVSGESQRRLIAPDLIIAELGNILWNRQRNRSLSSAEAAEITEAVATPSTFPVEIAASMPLLQQALRIAVEGDRSIYDSLYVALAVVEDTAVVTADARLVNALSTTRYARNVRLL